MRISMGTEFTLRFYAVSAQQSARNEFPHRIKIISGGSKYTGSSSLNMCCMKSMKQVLERKKLVYV